MNRLSRVLVLAATGLVAAAGASGAEPPAQTFVAVLTSAEEVPPCAAATSAARGSFVAHVVDEATGTVEWQLVANNLPGNIVAAHIHVAPTGVPGDSANSRRGERRRGYRHLLESGARRRDSGEPRQLLRKRAYERVSAGRNPWPAR